MAMTPEERRAARNAASRRWYLAHKAAKAASNKAGQKQAKQAAKPKARKAEAKPAKPQNGGLAKRLDKFVEKGTKAADAFKALVKDAAVLIAEAYKSGDEKLVARACRAFGRKLSLEVAPCPDDGKAMLSVSIGAKVFRVPKAQKAEQPAATPAAAPKAEAKHASLAPDGEEEKAETVVTVDPATLAGIEEGTVAAPAAEPADEDEDEDEDEDKDPTDEERLAELRDKDPDDLTDDEREELAQADEGDDWSAGRADMMREMEAQGSFDD